MADGKVTVLYDGDTSGIDKANSEAESKVNSVGKKLGGIAKSTAIAIGTAFVAAGAAALKFGTEFETSLAKASTLIDTNVTDMDKLGQKMLELSDSSGIAASELNEALYQALSAGVPATEDMSEALTFLEANTRLAKAGFTDVTTAIDTTTSIINAYGMSLADADKVHKILMQTQNKGKTTVGELGTVLAQVTPTAAAFGVSFEQIGAALANMTAKGTPAAQATTQLNALFAELGKSGTTAAESLAAATEGTEYAGKSFSDLMKDGVPLNKVLDLIGKYAKDNGKSMLDMFSSIEAGKAAISNAEENSQGFADALAAMSAEADVVGEALEKVTQTTEEKFKKTLNELKNVFIQLYNAMAPAIEQLLPAFSKLITQIAPMLSDLVVGIMPLIVSLLDQLLPPLTEIISKLLPVIVSLLNVLIPPILQIVEALLPPLIMLIDALLPILDLVITLLQPILDLFIALLQPILELITMALEPLLAIITPLIELGLKLLGNQLKILLEVFQNVMSGIFEYVSGQFARVKDIFGGVIDFIKNVFTGNWSGAWEAVKNIFANVWEGIVAVFKMPLNWIIDGINGFLKGLNKIKVPDWVPLVGGKGINIPLIPRLKKGADFIPQDYFPAFLDYGERVLTQEQNIKFSAMGGLGGMERNLSSSLLPQQKAIIQNNITLTGNLEADGFKLATLVLRNIDDAKKFS